MRPLHCAICAALLCAVLVAGEGMPLLAPPFVDGAVLQRSTPITVWGWSVPGTQVEVRLVGAAGGAVSAVAGADGRWQADLPALAAGGPFELRAVGGGREAVAHDVLVGDVWLCSGQSNMEMLVKDAADPQREDAEAAGALVRQFRVERNRAGEPQPLLRGTWKAAVPGEVQTFSAVAYAMARELHRHLGIPIGVINSSWGGTGLQYWTSGEGLSRVPGEAERVARFRSQAAAYAAQTAAHGGREYPELASAWYAAHDPGTSAAIPWWRPESDETEWRSVEMPSLLCDRGLVPHAFRGVTWLRRGFELPAGAEARSAFLRLGRISDADTVWVNGHEVGGSEWPSMSRGYRLPAGILKAGANHLAIRVTTVNGHPGMSGQPADLRLNLHGVAEPVALAGMWTMRVGAAFEGLPAFPICFDRLGGLTTLYNGMIAPLAPIRLAGVAWYQGESNAQGGHRYRELLPALIADWRQRFAAPELPFLIVSLAAHRARLDMPGESDWADLREDQAMTVRTIPRCGLAVAIDVGDARDIHPKDKRTVGTRLALAARAVAHGEDVEWSGPWYRSMRQDGAAIRLSFDHVGGGLVTSDGGPLRGFAVAGEDRVFVHAQARIEGDEVVVSAAAVPRPAAVRYAWADNPACNLANRAGLPAVPFRTDDWPRTDKP